MGKKSYSKKQTPSPSQAKAPTKAQPAAAKQQMTQKAASRIQSTQQIKANTSPNNSNNSGRLFAARAQSAAAKHAHHGTTMGKK